MAKELKEGDKVWIAQRFDKPGFMTRILYTEEQVKVAETEGWIVVPAVVTHAPNEGSNG